MPTLGPVCGIAATECMPPYNTFEAAAFGNPNRIHVIARSKECRAHHIPGFYFLGKIAKFRYAFDRHPVEFLDVAQQGFCDPMLLLIVKPQLDAVVTVALLSFALQHAIGSGEHYRYRRDKPLGVIDAGLT